MDSIYIGILTFKVIEIIGNDIDLTFIDTMNITSRRNAGLAYGIALFKEWSNSGFSCYIFQEWHKY